MMARVSPLGELAQLEIMGQANPRVQTQLSSFSLWLIVSNCLSAGRGRIEQNLTQGKLFGFTTSFRRDGVTDGG